MLRWLLFILCLPAFGSNLLLPLGSKTNVLGATTQPGIALQGNRIVVLDDGISQFGTVPDLGAHRFSFSAKEGEEFTFDVVAARMGSSLDPVFKLFDSQGKELLRVDDSPAQKPDLYLRWTAPRAGHFTAEIRDLRHQGGDKHFFVLRKNAPPLDYISPEREAFFRAGPTNFPVRGKFKAAQKNVHQITIDAPAKWVYRARTRSEGFPCDAVLRLLDANGKQIAQSNPETFDAVITNDFKSPGTYSLEARELVGRSGNYILEAFRDQPGFEISAEQFDLTKEVKLQIQRNQYEGPIEVSSNTDKIEIPAKTNQFTLKINGRGWTKLQAKGTNGFVTYIKSTPALKKIVPQLLVPPRKWDGYFMGVEEQP